ncbi:MAG: transketolase, partial [Calditrichaeota bacterium]
CTLEQYFAQLYAHADVEAEPMTGGRQMNAHFATRLLNPDGSWKNLTEQYNSSADLSPTGSQMPRLVGLAYASRLYRELEALKDFTQFSRNGNEVAFGTIGNASCAEGMFWEAVNALGVLKSPAVIAIWDDEYGISVPNEYQVTKGNLSEVLKGFQREPGSREGFDIYTVKGWDYPALVETFLQAATVAREEHVPAIVHVVELTQPQGHSTSGSHERYKPRERLEWERAFDCNRKFREWILNQGLASEAELEALEAEEQRRVEETRDRAWEAYQTPIRKERTEVAGLIACMAEQSRQRDALLQVRSQLLGLKAPLRRDIFAAIREALMLSKDDPEAVRRPLIEWKQTQEEVNRHRYGDFLYVEGPRSARRVREVEPRYSANPPLVYGFEVLNACFDAILKRDPRVVAFGEDVGRLGDVNQGFKGLQEKYGELRVSDTGIRECTILGQAIGLAMRGLRPIAEVQYLDYLLYALQIMSDDLATVHWRSAGGQIAPVIVRTRGHRLEGVWHSGSLMAGIIHLVRGMNVLVPRDMTRAAGFYNTLLQSDEPGLIVEVLNGYRLKEALPENIGEITVPVGVPEVLREGSDVTLVTYGACCRIVLEAARQLQRVGISAEVIDVQSLLPFDLHGRILESLKKTSRIVFVDEDVPGGTTAYMLEEVVEKQGGYYWLDSEPRTIPGKAHRPAYGSDGDYFSKPNVEEIFYTVYELMHEVNPRKYPLFFK